MAARTLIADPDRWAETAAGTIAGLILRRVATSGRCSLALAGGATPGPVYEQLAGPACADRIPWHSLDVWFGDERAVPPDHPDSNYRSAHAALLSRVPIPPDHVHRMAAERADLESAAAEYARDLPSRLDVLLLGMGADGHTASLFPGHAAVGERRRRVVTVTGDVPVAPRLTVTAPVIADAFDVVVLVAGTDKARAVARALEGPLDTGALPAQLARNGLWVLDRDAASRLRRTSA